MTKLWFLKTIRNNAKFHDFVYTKIIHLFLELLLLTKPSDVVSTNADCEFDNKSMHFNVFSSCKFIEHYQYYNNIQFKHHKTKQHIIMNYRYYDYFANGTS